MKRNPAAYHSALRGELEAAPVQRAELPRGSVAIAHDIFKPLPVDFQTCDVLYAEPAWRPGFDAFNRRAGVTSPRTFNEYMASIAKAIDSTTTPVYLLLGRHAMRYVRQPDQIVDVRHDVVDFPMHCHVYRARLDVRPATQTDLIRALAARYQRVGDFCCGYGWTGRQFAEHGRAFVLSDVNAKCIGFIAEHAPAWFK